MSQTTTITVTGMTCGHCAQAVTEELSAVAGVTDVAVDLRAGADSPVTITSDATLDPAAVRAAVAEAGYAVAT
ncbi:MAG TPA: heavy-metal-associated domain-containing protein [Oryzihumus sp.]|nr:heavy-metal-associated domain-containing protein [Oryzihumus sp.]